MRHRPVLVTLLSIITLAAAPAYPWFATQGHDEVTRAAVALLPADSPDCSRAEGEACWTSLFRIQAEALAGASVAPDVFKLEKFVPQLDEGESPEHYIDLELFQGRPLPPNRYEYLAALRELDVDPEKIGTLPYSITEWTQRLTVTFARMRLAPDDAGFRIQALTYAGILSHYAADLVQPLHTTIHHNGLAEPPEYDSPRTGIHFAIDGLIRDVEPSLHPGVRPPAAFEDLWTSVLTELADSHGLVPAVYEMEIERGEGKVDVTSPEVRAFAQERYEEAARFVASLWLTAWKDSGEIQLPGWLGGK